MTLNGGGSAGRWDCDAPRARSAAASARRRLDLIMCARKSYPGSGRTSASPQRIMNKRLIAGVVFLFVPVGLRPAGLGAQAPAPGEVVLRAADAAVVSGYGIDQIVLSRVR